MAVDVPGFEGWFVGRFRVSNPGRRCAGPAKRSHTTPVRRSAKVVYPLHPLYGQDIEIVGAYPTVQRQLLLPGRTTRSTACSMEYGSTKGRCRLSRCSICTWAVGSESVSGVSGVPRRAQLYVVKYSQRITWLARPAWDDRIHQGFEQNGPNRRLTPPAGERMLRRSC